MSTQIVGDKSWGMSEGKGSDRATLSGAAPVWLYLRRLAKIIGKTFSSPSAQQSRIGPRRRCGSPPRARQQAAAVVVHHVPVLPGPARRPCSGPAEAIIMQQMPPVQPRGIPTRKMQGTACCC